MAINRHAIEERIVSNPAVMLGKPVIRGARMPVCFIVDFIESGHSPEETVTDCPDLTIEDVEAAVAYAAQENATTKDCTR